MHMDKKTGSIVAIVFITILTVVMFFLTDVSGVYGALVYYAFVPAICYFIGKNSNKK